MSLKIGIVGRRGSSLAAGIKASGKATLVAMCDIDARSLEAEANLWEVPLRFTVYSEMLEHVDAVFVTTPMQLHADQAIQALEAGKHVLSEVTACVSLDECWRLVEAVRRSGKCYMMSENYCYIRENVLVREMVRAGLFGELYYGEGEYLHDVKPMHHMPDGSPTWRYFWQVGQNGNTYPTHSLGPVMQWFHTLNPNDRIASVSCFGTGRYTDPEHPHDDTSLTMVRLESGKLIRLRLDMMSNRPHQMAYYSIQGTHGVYESSRLSGHPGHVWVGTNPSPGPVLDIERNWQPVGSYEHLLSEEWRTPSAEALKAGHGGGDFYVVRDFIEAALGERPNPIDVYSACEWTAAGLCSQESIANGGTAVRVPDFRNPSEPRSSVV